jgi:hypothetical protein
MGCRAAIRFDQVFTAAQMAASYTELYREVAGGRVASSASANGGSSTSAAPASFGSHAPD